MISCAEQTGYQPEILHSARRINDGISSHLALELHQLLGSRLSDKRCGRILVLGLTFKEDVPDLRNSKVADMVKTLYHFGHQVTVVDPLADAEEAYTEYDIILSNNGLSTGPYDIIVGAVAHKAFRIFSSTDLISLAASNAIVADIKGIWRKHAAELPPDIFYWQM